jgi:Phage integrase, N-terminal SAM-like domain/Putative transposase
MTQMSPLRRCMIEDMTVRNVSPATQRSYISAVLKFSRYFRRSPDQLELEDVRAFQVHLLPDGFHRIRHFGFMANRHRAARFALCRSLLADHGKQLAPKHVEPASLNSTNQSRADVPVCPHCGGVMRVIIRFTHGFDRTAGRTSSFRCDTS